MKIYSHIKQLFWC